MDKKSATITGLSVGFVLVTIFCSSLLVYSDSLYSENQMLMEIAEKIDTTSLDGFPSYVPTTEAKELADRFDSWLTTGTNITIIPLSTDEYNAVLKEYMLYEDVNVEMCWSAFSFAWGLHLQGWTGAEPFTVYRSGCSFLTQTVNGSSYQIQFGRTVTW